MNILTVHQAAAELNLTTAMVRHYLRRGAFPGATKSGRVWLIPVGAIEAFQRPARGWPAGVKRCPRCRGQMVDHECEKGEK